MRTNTFKFGLARNFLLAGIFLAKPLFAVPSFLIISDFDDTIKITGAHNPWNALYSTWVGRPPVAGMAELSRDWVAHSGTPWYVVSGSPKSLRASIETFFSDHRLPKAYLLLQNWTHWQTTEEYKVRTIKQLIHENELPIILVGDDSQEDADCFSKVKDHFRRQGSAPVAATYIHRTNPEHPLLPEDVVDYVSPAELVLHEMKSGRLTEQTLLEVLAEIAEKPAAELIPEFYYCPQSYRIPAALLENLSSIALTAVRAHERAISRYCRTR